MPPQTGPGHVNLGSGESHSQAHKRKKQRFKRAEDSPGLPVAGAAAALRLVLHWCGCSSAAPMPPGGPADQRMGEKKEAGCWTGGGRGSNLHCNCTSSSAQDRQ